MTIHPNGALVDGARAGDMIFKRLRFNARQLLVAVTAMLAAACHVSANGSVPCVDDSSCPSDYPYCVVPTGGTTGACFSTNSSPDAGSALGAVTIVGVLGHNPSDVVSGTVTVAVTGRAASGVKSVTLAAGSAAPLDPLSSSAPPIWYFAVATSGAGDVSLVATLTPGDPTAAPITSTPYILHVNNAAPSLTVADPTPQDARGGELVTLAVTTSKPVASLGGSVTLPGPPATTVGPLSLLSGTLGTDTSYSLGFVVPANAQPGTYDLTVTAADSTGLAAASVTKTITVYGAFEITSLTVTSLTTEVAGGHTLPAGTANSPITIAAAVPAAVPLGTGAAAFTLTDAQGNTRTLLETPTLASSATAQTYTLSDSIAATDASGVATIQATITDEAGNVATATATLEIDEIVPFLTGLAPNVAIADAQTGTPAGTVVFTGQASKPIAAASFTLSGGSAATGSCTCNGASCSSSNAAAAPVIACAVPVPTGLSAPAAVGITVSLQDLVGNSSSPSASSNRSSFQAVPIPVLTLGAPSPQQARPGAAVTVTVNSTQALSTISGSVVALGTGGAGTAVGPLSLISGTLGTGTSFVLGFVVPASGAVGGTYKLTVSGTDAAGGSTAPATATTQVDLPFSITTLTVSSAATIGSLPGGHAGSAINVSVTLPSTVPLAASAGSFTLTDAQGTQRTFQGSETVTSGATSTTITITDAIANADANGLATLRATITDAAGNQATASASLLINSVAPFLLGLAPNLSIADPLSGSPAGTISFSGQASAQLSQVSASITSGGTGAGACTCSGAGGSCSAGATAPTVTCSFSIPAVTASTTVAITVAMTDLFGNTSVGAANTASFTDIPLPSAVTLSPSSVSITAGSSANLTPSFLNGTGQVTNSANSSFLNVSAGVPFAVSPTIPTGSSSTSVTYTLLVQNQLGHAFSPAPTATVTVNQPLSFSVTYVPTSGAPTPGAITSGATTGTLSFLIPTLTGYTTASILDNNGAAVTIGATPVASAQIFAAQNATLTGVTIPTTRAQDARTLNYTLMLSNAASTSNFIAPLQVIPQVTLSGTTSLTPASITGGSTAALTLALPTFSGTTQTVSFLSAAGATLLNASGAGPLTSSELYNAGGSSLQVLPPTSTASAATAVYTFTLLASNAANSASQTATLTIIPAPVLASSTFTVAPAAITGGVSPSLSVTLPALTSLPASASAVSFAISGTGCGSGAVAKVGGGAVAISDLGQAISIPAPTTPSSANLVCTYTLTVANSATTPATAVATGSLTVIPTPTLSSATFAISPATISGGSSPSLSATLPSLTSAAPSASSVTFAISGAGCGSGPVAKTNGAGGPVALGDSGTTITFSPPSSTTTSAAGCTYTLTVSNSATTAATAAATGALSIVPVPVLASSSFVISPAAITGGTAPTLSTTLPALASGAGSASSASFAISGTGCGSGAVSKSGGGAVGVADLGNPITFAAPTTSASANLNCTYTLTVSNAATTAATATATGTLSIIPTPTLTSGTFTLSPATITGGTSPGLSATLPSLSSGGPSASSVTFAITGTGCGSGAVAKTSGGGGAVALGDLGSTITFAAPTTTSTTNTTCTYTLTVSNSATTPASAIATGALTVVPTPVLASSSFTIAPAAITGGTTPSLSTTLPALASGAGSASSASFAISGTGCGSGAVAKSGGGAVGVADLGNPITFAAPTTSASANLNCTYTLTVSNAATTAATATATGTLSIIPTPTLASGTFTLSPATITGGTSPGLSATLPSLSSGGPSASSVTFAITGTGCGSGAVAKTSGGGGAVALGDLGSTITFAAPTTTSTTNTTCTYTLTVSNSATTPASAIATGALTVVPTPVLASSSFTIAPAAITGGTTPSLSTTLPALTSGANSASSASFAISGTGCGSGAVAKSGGGAVGVADLGHAITFAAPTTSASANLSCTYTLTVSNAATTAATTAATGSLSVIPLPTLSATTLTVSPASIAGGTSPSLSTTLPSLTSGGPSASSASFTISGAGCGSGAVAKTSGGGGAVGLGDLGTTITFAAPSTTSSSSATCTYTFSVSNGATTPGSASAAGTLTVVPTPVFGAAMTITPNVLLTGTSTSGLLQFALPALSTGTASTISMTVAPLPDGASNNTVTPTTGSFIAGDLGTTVPVNPPNTVATDGSKTFTYSLTATNSLNATSAPATATATTYAASTALSDARVGGTATLLSDGTVLLTGGGSSISQGVCTLDSNSNTAEIYNPATGTTTATTSNMTVKRCMHAAVPNSTNTKVYIIGGSNSTGGCGITGVTNCGLVVDVYVVGSGFQTVTSSTPQITTNRTGLSAVMIPGGSNAGSIVVAGGYDTGGNGLTSLELFNPSGSGNTASTVYSGGGTSAFNVGRGEPAVALAGNFIYYIGGWDGNHNYSNSVDALDITLGATAGHQITHTSSLGNSVSQYASSAIALSSSSLLVVGGDNGAATLNNIQTYTVNSSTGAVTAISTAGSLNTARARFPLLATGTANQYIVFGGTSTQSTSSSNDTATNSIETINSSSLAATNYGSTLGAARQAEAAVNLQVSGATNPVFLISGGSSSATAGAEVVIGPPLP